MLVCVKFSWVWYDYCVIERRAIRIYRVVRQRRRGRRMFLVVLILLRAVIYFGLGFACGFTLLVGVVLLVGGNVLKYGVVCLFVLVYVKVTLPVGSRGGCGMGLANAICRCSRGGGHLPLRFTTISVPRVTLKAASSRGNECVLRGMPANGVHVRVRCLNGISVSALVGMGGSLILGFAVEGRSFGLGRIAMATAGDHSNGSASSRVSHSTVSRVRTADLCSMVSLVPNKVSRGRSVDSTRRVGVHRISDSDNPRTPVGTVNATVVHSNTPVSGGTGLSTVDPAMLDNARAPTSLTKNTSPTNKASIHDVSARGVRSVRVIHNVPSIRCNSLASKTMVVGAGTNHRPLHIGTGTGPGVCRISVKANFRLKGGGNTLGMDTSCTCGAGGPVSDCRRCRHTAAGLLCSGAFFGGGLHAGSDFSFVCNGSRHRHGPSSRRAGATSRNHSVNFALGAGNA